MIRTTLTERYGIELPFVSAGMGFIAIPRLAAAVSNAGGLGQLATGAAPPEILRELIRATRALTGRPFAVNFIIETIAFGRWPPKPTLECASRSVYRQSCSTGLRHRLSGSEC